MIAWIRRIFKAIFRGDTMPDLSAPENSGAEEERTVDTNGFVLNVPPDAPDIRDRMYQPSLIRIPDRIVPEWNRGRNNIPEMRYL